MHVAVDVYRFKVPSAAARFSELTVTSRSTSDKYMGSFSLVHSGVDETATSLQPPSSALNTS
jgi:hypothetical protein